MLNTPLLSLVIMALVLGLSRGFSSWQQLSLSPPASQVNIQADVYSWLQTNWPWCLIGLVLFALLGVAAFWFSNQRNNRHKPQRSRSKMTMNAPDERTNTQSAQLLAQQRQIQQLQEEILKFKKTIDTLNRKINSLEARLDQIDKDSYLQSSKASSRHPAAQQNYPDASQDRHYYENPGYQASPPAYTASEPWEAIVSGYNTNPSSWEKNSVAVSEIPVSLERRRRDSASLEVTLGESSNSNYWVVTADSFSYWLVPKANFKVSGAGFDTFQALFNIQGQPSSRLKLVKPSSVKPNSNQEWELIEKGEIQFL
jgi:hypothetical protein